MNPASGTVMRHVSPICVALVLAPTAFASTADPLADAVREAVAAHKLHDSDLKGLGAAATPVREMAVDGGVLVGLEVGIGGSSPTERVAAVRPVYRVGGKNRAGSPAGHFLSDEVTRTVRLLARDGFVVGGMRVSAGKRIDGLSLRFVRVDEASLNPSDSYESDWVGTARAGGRELVDGQGRPVVGIFFRAQSDLLLGLGLTFAELPASPQPAPAPVTVSPLPASPEPTAEAPPTSGNTGLAMAVFAMVAIPVGLIGLVTARRRQTGRIHQLPRATKSVPDIHLNMTRPPSIPTDLLLPGERPLTRLAGTDPVITLETDVYRH
jgi:hypothetical protein